MIFGKVSQYPGYQGYQLIAKDTVWRGSLRETFLYKQYHGPRIDLTPSFELNENSVELNMSHKLQKLLFLSNTISISPMLFVQTVIVFVMNVSIIKTTHYAS